MNGTSPAPTGPVATDAHIDRKGALDTLPKLLLRNASRHADRPAMRHKDFGIWQTWTWAQLRDEVRTFAIGLRKLGLERGDVVAIIGDNRPRLYATFAAVQSLGGIPVPVYQDAVADEMAYVLEHAEARFAVVGDQEQVDKVISIAERLPNSSASSTTRSAASRPTIRTGCIPSATCRAWAETRCAPTRAPRAGGSRRSPRAEARTSA